MNRLKVIAVDRHGIEFEGGVRMYSSHVQDCCEHHELTFTDLRLSDFDGLEFDLSNDDFFKRIEGYGIELIPIQGYSIRIPGHGYNNGYYGTDITLCIDGPNINKQYDVSECQVIDE